MKSEQTPPGNDPSSSTTPPFAYRAPRGDGRTRPPMPPGGTAPSATPPPASPSPAPAPTPGPAKGKGGLGTILAIVAVIGGGAAAWWFMAGPGKSAPETTATGPASTQVATTTPGQGTTATSPTPEITPPATATVAPEPPPPDPREVAQKARTAASDALALARRLGADRTQAEIVSRAMAREISASNDFTAGRFAAATTSWNEAARLAGEGAVTVARARLDEALAAPGLASANDFAVSRWTALRALTSQAEASAAAGDMAAAAQLYVEASEGVPALREAILEEVQRLAKGAADQRNEAMALVFYSQLHKLDRSNAEALGYLYRNKFKSGQVVTSPNGLKLAYVPPGTYQRGSSASESGRDRDEVPAQVTLTRGYFIGATEITQAQWDAVMPASQSSSLRYAEAPAGFAGPQLPVHGITWFEATEFCRRLSEMEGVTYRLPTEAEWEHAARAGTTSAFSTGRNSLSVREANIDDGTPAARGAPVAVSSAGAANPWGLFDVHGNVWEWCSDWSAPYPAGPQTDPIGPTDREIGRVDTALRIVRGGSWFEDASFARSANRWEYSPILTANYIGFRVVREVTRFDD